MSEREELASLARDAIYAPAAKNLVTYDIADAILAAGYTKPRQVSTVEELDALPAKSTILDSDGTPWVSDGDTAQPWASLCEDAQGGPIWSDSDEIPLPATVLYSPAAAS